MIKYKSKVDIAYDYLIDKINQGEYNQGDRLVISQLSKQLSISDIPVREALRRMESDGYVKIIANQGAVVSGLSKTSLINIFQIKGVLEGYASRLAVDCLTPEQIKQFYVNIEKSEEAFRKKNYKKVSLLNYEFHMGMYENIPNRELYNTIYDLWQKWSITKMVFSVAPQRIPASVGEHKKILELIEAKKHDEVERFVRMHKQAAGAVYQEKLREYPIPEPGKA
jgi:DNA-binding GntR family transcriptional regulator